MYGKFQRGNDWGSVLTIPPPPPPREGGGGERAAWFGSETTLRGNKGYAIHSGVLLPAPLSLGLTYVNPLVVSLGA
jgi:hypothetical protein